MFKIDEVALYKYTSMQDVLKGVQKHQLKNVTDEMTHMIYHFMATHPPHTVNAQVEVARDAMEYGKAHYKGGDNDTRNFHALQIVGQMCGWKILDLMVAQAVCRKLTHSKAEAMQLYFGVIGQAILDSDNVPSKVVQATTVPKKLH